MTDDNAFSNRRGFMLFGAAAAASLIFPAAPALAAPASKAKAKALPAPPTPRPALRPGSTRALRLHVVNTGERWNGIYWRDGAYVPEATRRLDALLRDHRAGQTHKMDPKLFDQLWELQQRLDSSEPWRVVSAYRSPQTNAAARRAQGGVARNSFHIQGKALDVDLADRSVRAIRQAAMELHAGGVGQYARSDFVHLDTGPVRSWG